ncbi:unnamed protein product [Nippostrongylus brasiliensis]|uniref:Protein kinase domain-containing protein n=1 Tax=Nippostrongylus brasiliensis TaxID=27835 RepID=A0A0N4Y8K2_NIPBR|nr:unnamed protein product [Nippostrongylus brasiliensis]
MLPRDDVLYLLKKDGDFLLRMTEADTQGARIEMVLSTLHDPTGRKRPKRNEPVDDDSVKIAGFGLARKATVYALKGNRRVSIRWSAPEAVSTFRFTQKSDVYSFGVIDRLPMINKSFTTLTN